MAWTVPSIETDESALQTSVFDMLPWSEACSRIKFPDVSSGRLNTRFERTCNKHHVFMQAKVSVQKVQF